MYTIIGGDQKEYGPIPADDVRQWIAEGRLNEQSLMKGAGDAEFRPLEKFPEFADAFAPRSPMPNAPPPLGGAIPLLEHDYNLDLGDCISRGWELVKNNFWPVVGTTTLVLFAIFLVNQFFGLFTRSAVNDMIVQHRVSPRGIFIIVVVMIVSAPVYTVFSAGLFKYYLKQIRGETAGVGDAFSGFGPHLGQLIMLSLVQIIFVFLGYMLCVIPGIYLAVAWYFAIPLVIDKGLGFWEAMELSRKMVNKHWFLVFAFLLVYGMLSMIGIIACFIGILVTLPIGFAALMFAYETIFTERPAA
jgi:hypothetical protein